MNQSQCTDCGHIVTGFEQQDFELRASILAAKDTEIARLTAELAAAREREVALVAALSDLTRCCFFQPTYSNGRKGPTCLSRQGGAERAAMDTAAALLDQFSHTHRKDTHDAG